MDTSISRRGAARLALALLYLPSLYLLGQLGIFGANDLFVAFAVLSVFVGLLLADWRALLLPPIALLLVVQDAGIQIVDGLAGAIFVIGTLIAEAGMIAGVLAARTWSGPAFLRGTGPGLRLVASVAAVALCAVWIHYAAYVFTTAFDTGAVCESEPCLGIPAAEGDRGDGPGISGLQWYAIAQGTVTLLGVAYAALLVAGALRPDAVTGRRPGDAPRGSRRWLLAPGVLAVWIATVGIASFGRAGDEEPVDLARCVGDLGITVYSPGPALDGMPLRGVGCYSGSRFGIEMTYGPTDPFQPAQVMVQSRPACRPTGTRQAGISGLRGRRVRVGGAVGVLYSGRPHPDPVLGPVVLAGPRYERLDLFTGKTWVTIQKSTARALRAARALRPGFPVDPSDITVPVPPRGAASRLPPPAPGALRLQLPCPTYSLPSNRTVDVAGE